jgi:hypothetical protein
MKLVAFVGLVLVILTTPAAAQSVDNDLPRCRDFPFPFSVLCLANQASYRPIKECPEISQNSSKPAGQQCDAGRGFTRSASISRDPGPDPDPEPPTHECKGHDKGSYGGKK